MPDKLRYGRTVLQAASEGGHLNTFRLLLERNIEDNARLAKEYGRTALQVASGKGHMEVVWLLLERVAHSEDEVACEGGRGHCRQLQKAVTWR
jgi:ankyrin repeat protein